MTAPSRAPLPVVIDASVALKWQLEDEEHTPQALALRDDVLIRKEATPYAPTLYIYEVINGIVSAVRRRRVEPPQGEEALRNLFAMEIGLRTPSVERAYNFALQYRLSAYDSAYVAVAEGLGADLWTADRELYEAAGSGLGWVRWIGDYSSSSLS